MTLNITKEAYTKLQKEANNASKVFFVIEETE